MIEMFNYLNRKTLAHIWYILEIKWSNIVDARFATAHNFIRVRHVEDVQLEVERKWYLLEHVPYLCARFQQHVLEVVKKQC